MYKFIRLFWIAFLAACLTVSPLGGSIERVQARAANSAEQGTNPSKPGTALSAVPKPLAPSGYITITNPTFTWAKVTAATQYLFVVYKDGALYYSKPVAASTCVETICASRPTSILPYASYHWIIRAMIGGVWGPFSAPKTFNVYNPSVGPIPLAPTGTINVNKYAVFTWTRVTGASQYQLIAYRGATTYYLDVVDGCTTIITCSHNGDYIPNGTYAWRVRAMVGGVWGAYSAGKIFTIFVSPSFYSPFDSKDFAWTGVLGVWSIANGYYQSEGFLGMVNSAVHDNNYATMTYTVRMYRAGCNDCANAIMFRGTPEPTFDIGYWNKGYRLAVTNSGYFHIGYYENGYWNWIIPWTYSKAINYPQPNDLKVTMNGTYTQVFINGSRVAYGHLDLFDTGRVGFMFYRDVNSQGNRMYVDSAILTESAPAASSFGAGGINMDELGPVNAAAAGDPNVSP